MDERRHAKGPVTRDKLIEAAGEVFAEKGLHGALIRDITRRAGANIASVNYYFRDKFELYMLVLRQAHEAVLAAGNQPLTAAAPAARVRQLLSALLTAALDPSRPAWHTSLLGRELLEPTPALDLMDDIMQEPTRRLHEAIWEMRPDLTKEQNVLATCGVVAQCLFYVHHRHIARRLFPGLPDPPVATLVDQVVEFSLAALRGLGQGTPDDETRANQPAARRKAPATRSRRARRGA